VFVTKTISFLQIIFMSFELAGIKHLRTLQPLVYFLSVFCPIPYLPQLILFPYQKKKLRNAPTNVQMSKPCLLITISYCAVLFINSRSCSLYLALWT